MSLPIEEKDLNTFVDITTNEFFQSNLSMLRDLFDKSLEVKEGIYPLWQLQVELWECITFIDKERRNYSNWETKYRRLLPSLTSRHALSERIIAAKTTLLEIEGKIAAAKFLIKQLRSIGDGIAWRFLRYDRSNLRILAEHEYVSVVPEGKGRLAEFDRFAQIAAEGCPVLVNGITNCVRFGDMVIWDESKGNFEIIEVKTGPSEDSRSKRQSEKRECAQEGISNSTHKVYSIGAVSKVQLGFPILTYVRDLEGALAEADREFASVRTFGDYLSFCVFSLHELKGVGESNSTRIREEVLSRCFSIRTHKGDAIFPANNIAPTVAFSPLLAPYAIYPIRKDQRFGLLAGDYFLFSYLNIHGFTRYLVERGWEVKHLTPPQGLTNINPSHVPAIRVRKQGSHRTVELGIDVIGMAATELWTPDSIERLLDAGLENWTSGGYITANFSNTGDCAWD